MEKREILIANNRDQSKYRIVLILEFGSLIATVRCSDIVTRVDKEICLECSCRQLGSLARLISKVVIQVIDKESDIQSIFHFPLLREAHLLSEF